MARIRIKCKNPSRIPFERVYELGGGCYLISFTAEGVEQISNKPDGEDGDGGNEDPKEDDPLEEDDPLSQ